MPYPQFDRSRLILKPLSEREHDLDLSVVMPLEAPVDDFAHPDPDTLADRILTARRRGATVLLIMGVHVLRQGNPLFIRDLMSRGLLTHVAGNGAVAIHDFELAFIGATTQSVARYIRTGEFGLWAESGWMNEAVNQGAAEGLGFGEVVGRLIAERHVPHRELSLLAAGYELGLPVTIHVGIGSDIIHEHPICDGAAMAEASYPDFLTLANTVSRLEGGVFFNFGTAVKGPEVYLKALGMARNLARQEGSQITHFATAVFDLANLGSDFRHEPNKADPAYYFRPWKTTLVRTVQDGGESFYFGGEHRVPFPLCTGASFSVWSDVC